MRPPGFDACTDDTQQPAILRVADTRLVPAKKSSTAMYHSAWYIDKSSRFGSKQDRTNFRLSWIEIVVWMVLGRSFWNWGSTILVARFLSPGPMIQSQFQSMLHQKSAGEAGCPLCGEQRTRFQGKARLSMMRLLLQQ
jgi:hypothetical protein